MTVSTLGAFVERVVFGPYEPLGRVSRTSLRATPRPGDCPREELYLKLLPFGAVPEIVPAPARSAVIWGDVLGG